MNKKSKQRNRILYTVAFLIVLMSPAIVGTYSSIDVNVNDGGLSLNPSFIDLPSDAVLNRIDVRYDDNRDTELTTFRWITGDRNLVEVQYDESNNLVLYIDTSNTESSQKTQVSKRDVAYLKALEFLESLANAGLGEMPDESELVEEQYSEGRWQFEWSHIVNSLLVEDDFIRVYLDRSGTRVTSFVKVWNNIPTTISRDLKSFQTNEELRIIKYQDEYRIAANQGNGVWKDIVTDEIVQRIETYGHDKDIHAYDDIEGRDEKTYDLAAYVAELLQDGTQPTTTYYEDLADYTILVGFEDLEVFAWFGHGQDYGEDETALDTASGTQLSPSDIASMDLSGMKLAFLSACMSFNSSKDSIAEAFYDRSAQYVFGWKGDVDKQGAIDFSEDFFEHAMDEYNLGASYTYAKNLASSDIQSNATYIGDTSVYLRHVGSSEDESLWLGGGPGSPETDLDHTDTLSTETDWYSFSVTGASYYVELWVDPTGSLDADVWIYDDSENLKGSDTNGGTGVTEHISGFIASVGVYYIKIMRDGSTSGSYDLDVRIYSS